MDKNGILLVISGPTGAEKDKVIDAFLENHKEIYTQVTYTTRPKKLNEEEGIDFYFVSNKEFFDKVDKGHFLEWAEVYDNYYGTPKHNVLRKLKDGKDVLLQVDIKGALEIKEQYNEAVLIFILPSSIDAMKQKILNSKKDTPENLLRKFNSAYKAIQSISKYNYGVVNDDIDKAVTQIENIITAENCRVGRIDNPCIHDK